MWNSQNSLFQEKSKILSLFLGSKIVKINHGLSISGWRWQSWCITLYCKGWNVWFTRLTVGFMVNISWSKGPTQGRQSFREVEAAMPKIENLQVFFCSFRCSNFSQVMTAVICCNPTPSPEGPNLRSEDHSLPAGPAPRTHPSHRARRDGAEPQLMLLFVRKMLCHGPLQKVLVI